MNKNSTFQMLKEISDASYDDTIRESCGQNLERVPEIVLCESDVSDIYRTTNPRQFGTDSIGKVVDSDFGTVDAIIEAESPPEVTMPDKRCNAVEIVHDPKIHTASRFCSSDASYDVWLSLSMKIDDHSVDHEDKSIDDDYLNLYRILRGQPAIHRPRILPSERCSAKQRIKRSANKFGNDIEQLEMALSEVRREWAEMQSKNSFHSLNKNIQRSKRIKNKAVELENKLQEEFEEFMAILNPPAT